MAAFAQVGIRLPHQSGGQARAGRAVTRAQLRAGDVVVYRGHVGLAIGGGEMIAATTPKGGVKRQPIWGRPIGYRRLI